MPAWYDIQSLSRDRSSDPCEGIDRTKSEISNLIKEQIIGGTPSNRIVLGGFSQGGAVSIYTGFTFPQKLGGLLLLSCYIPRPEKFFKEISKENLQTPYLMCHDGEILLGKEIL
eukprot:TRINITY_DN1812_c0_g1_i10.p1 TRINITY_DN1812_c0_g1~~TRINITY_DN1812_c0_g1_i10.p1  ORF type:complete len:114 (-),score=19.13 TRINITY_DN1812_c0_g1_i10:330-671(-)